jgi:tetratricopeptide (TPR) repeat protein
VSIGDRLEQLAAALREDFDVDVGLANIASQVAGRETLSEQLDVARRGVRQRLRALAGAQQRLQRLPDDFERIASMSRFTEEGWPDRRRELNALLQEKPWHGLQAWLEDVAWALAHFRLDAAERLTADDVDIPSVLRHRLRNAGRELRDGSHPTLAGPVLTLLADGVDLPDAEATPAPSSATRAELALLFARMAVLAGADPDPDLGRAEAAGATEVSLAAVRSMAARQEGKAPTGEDVRADATDLGVAVEAVHRALQAGKRDDAREAATEIVAAQRSLVGIEFELQRLVEEAPPEVWLAVADRARDTGDRALVRIATDRAEAHAALEDYATLSHVADLRLALAGDATADELADQLVRAGDFHLWNGNAEGAIERYQKALDKSPGHVEASLSLADATLARWWNRPTHESAPHLLEGLQLIETAYSAGGLDSSRAWSLIDLAYLHLALTNAASPERVDHLWMALLTAGRCVARGVEQARFWAPLARTSQSTGLYRVAIFAAEQMNRLARTDSDDASAREEFVKAAANLGRYDVALEQLGSPSSPWDYSAQGFIKMRMGMVGDAVEPLRLGVPEGWSRQALVEALLLTEQFADADEQASLMRQESRGRLSDVDGLAAAAFAELVLGEFAQAEELGQRFRKVPPRSIDEGFGEFIIGASRVLAGDASGISFLIEAAASSLTPRDHGDWVTITEPVLGLLAHRRNRDLPDLGPVRAAHRARQEKLETRVDALDEIAAMRPLVAEDPVADAALTLVSTMIHVARGEVDAAREAGAGVELVRRLPEWDLLAGQLEVSRPIPPAAATDDEGRPDDALPGHADVEAQEGHEEPLRRLVLLLPPSWFEGCDDPVQEHEIFVRVLPSVRRLAAWEIPGVSVRTDGELEPSGYVVQVDGVEVERGSLERSARFATADTAVLFGLTSLPLTAPEGLVAVARDGTLTSRLVELLTASATEVAVDRVVAAGEARRSELEL